MKLVVTLETDFITHYRIITHSVKTLFQRVLYESKSSRLIDVRDLHNSTIRLFSYSINLHSTLIPNHIMFPKIL